MARVWLIVGLLGCGGDHLCDRPPEVSDATESLDDETLGWLQEQLLQFDEDTLRPMCMDLMAWRKGPLADREGGRTTTRVEARRIAGGRSLPDLRAAACRGALLQAEVSTEDFALDGFLSSPSEPAREALETLETESPPFSEAEAVWLATCVAGPRPDGSLRRILEEQCGAGGWSRSHDQLAEGFWRVEEQPWVSGDLLVGEVETLGAPSDFGAVYSLAPHRVSTTMTSRRNTTLHLDDRSVALADLPLLPYEEAAGEEGVHGPHLPPVRPVGRVVLGVVGDEVMVVSAPGVLWALNAGELTLRELGPAPFLWSELTPVQGGLLAHDGHLLTEEGLVDVGWSYAEGTHVVHHGPWSTATDEGHFFRSSILANRPPEMWRSLFVDGQEHRVLTVGYRVVLGSDGAYWTAATDDGRVLVSRTTLDGVMVGSWCTPPERVVSPTLVPDGEAVSISWIGDGQRKVVRLRFAP